MLTRVKRENKKRSKTTNLCTNLMKAGKRHRLDIGYIHFFFLIFTINACITQSISPKYPDTNQFSLRLVFNYSTLAKFMKNL